MAHGAGEAAIKCEKKSKKVPPDCRWAGTGGRRPGGHMGTLQSVGQRVGGCGRGRWPEMPRSGLLAPAGHLAWVVGDPGECNSISEGLV